jgi:hypothetical protein
MYILVDLYRSIPSRVHENSSENTSTLSCNGIFSVQNTCSYLQYRIELKPWLKFVFRWTTTKKTRVNEIAEVTKPRVCKYKEKCQRVIYHAYNFVWWLLFQSCLNDYVLVQTFQCQGTSRKLDRMNESIVSKQCCIENTYVFTRQPFHSIHLPEDINRNTYQHISGRKNVWRNRVLYFELGGYISTVSN